MFKFKINDKTWKVQEMSQAEIRSEMKRHNENPTEFGKYFGITYADEQIILIDEELCEERKRSTLLHELGHCYIISFITHLYETKSYSEEDVADIISNSHDIIRKIIDKYFE